MTKFSVKDASPSATLAAVVCVMETRQNVLSILDLGGSYVVSIVLKKAWVLSEDSCSDSTSIIIHLVLNCGHHIWSVPSQYFLSVTTCKGMIVANV